MSRRDADKENYKNGNINNLGDDVYLEEESEEEYFDEFKDDEKNEAKDEEEKEEENEVLRELLMGEKILAEDELRAELEGDDLHDDKHDGFVVGQFDDIREREAYMNMGVDPDSYEKDFVVEENDQIIFDEDFFKAKRAADKRMKYRDRILNQENQRQRHSNFLSIGLQKLLEEEIEEDLEEVDIRRRARREALSKAVAQSDLPDLDNVHAAKKCLASGYLEGGVDERYTEAIITCFRFFLHKFILNREEENEESQKSKGNNSNHEDRYPFYINLINKMINDDSTSLYISTRHLIEFHCANLVNWIEHKPLRVLELLDMTLTEEVRLLSRIYASRTCKILLTEWPYVNQLRNLRANDLNKLIQISGVITKRGVVQPKLKVLYLTCVACGVTLNEQPVYFSEHAKPNMPKRCVYCQRNAFIPDRIKTIYQDFQRLTIQESPGSVLAGRVPRQRELIVIGELVDKVKPGEEVQVLGIYQTKYDIVLNIKMGFPVFATQILCNNITRKEDVRIGELTDEDIIEIKKLSRDKNITERIIASIAPSIWGHREIKVALAYAMFGGVCKGKNVKVDSCGPNALKNNSFCSASLDGISQNMAGGHSIRGDINVLLIGDPGLGKSQALQYVHKTFHRTVYTTGKGASAVGLTAGVKRDTATGEWTLEGGALVLADEGICLIDEFDKMTDKDRVSIHEAMEQQSISISKAGIVTQLRARCSVIAAANPKYGRYEPSLTFKENVDLSDPILSRFDIIAVMRDIPNLDIDSSIGDYVVSNHMRYHPLINTIDEFDREVKELESAMHSHYVFQPIPQELLQKYILYARNNCRPTLEQLPNTNLRDKLSSFYARLRQRVFMSGGLPVTLRHIESMVRIAEANAKMRLSNVVTSIDVDKAIATILDSFISSQKYAVANKLSKEFARYRALAKGGLDALNEICSRCIQLAIKRNNLLNRKNKRNIISKADKSLNHVQEEESVYEQLQDSFKSVKLSLAEFKKAAIENKFNEYNIECWLKSKTFNEHYCLVKENGEHFIFTKRFYQK